jgi:amino acid adenylation domain-containing protein/thioester reductase-like protein
LASEQCQIAQQDIDDLYPTTPLQEGLMAITETKGAEAYTDRFLFTLPSQCDITQAQRAWETVVQTTGILRTRIMLTADGQTYQVVCRPTMSIPWQSASSIAEFLNNDRGSRMGLGSPLMRLAIIQSAESKVLALTLHHAIYDGFTLHFCVQQAERAYRGHRPPRSDFIHFIRHLDENASNVDRAGIFWQQEMLHLNSVVFPKHPSADIIPRASCSVRYDSPRAVSRTLQLGSPTSKVRLAWALLVAMYTGSEDVTFGAVVDGRRNLPGDLGAVAGPTIATYPVRLVIQRDRTVQQSLTEVHAKIDATVPFEQTGLQQIRRMGAEAATACDFQNLLIVQTDDTLSTSPVFGPVTAHLGALNSFPGYSIILLCTPSEDAWRFEMFVDEEVWSCSHAEHMLYQLGHILQQLDDTRNKEVPLARLNLISPQDQAMIAKYNGTLPVQSLSSIPELIHSQVVRTPQHYAICAWDGGFTYQQLHDHAVYLALQLRPLITRSGAQFVPIVFERSKWVPIAMLAVSLAGAAFVLLDPSHPLERNVQICRTVKATLGLTSQSQLKVAQSIAAGPWIVPGANAPTPRARAIDHAGILPTSVAANDLLYAVFTSGSTGTPKGVLIEHGSYCSAIAAQQLALEITAESRVLQISSYAFDSFAVEILTVLASGGRICIPSDDEVNGDLAGAIQRFQATWLCITPSMLRLLAPEEVPSLRSVVAVGESMLPGQIAQWCDRVQLLCGYGPTECCTGAAAHRITSSTADVRTIGTGMGCLLWAVHPDDVETLMPVNTVGELVLQGPIVGRGYLNDPVKTAESFKTPAWAQRYHPGGPRFYRTGDLVRLNLDGTCSFLGRKNQHTKLRGQRLDLAEVEHHLLRAFGADANGIVAIIRPPASGTTPCLAAIIQIVSSPERIENGASSSSTGIFQRHTSEFLARARRARDELTRKLPSIMVPGFYLQASNLPLMVSGKVNRRAIDTCCAQLSVNSLHALASLDLHEAHTEEDTLHEPKEPVAWTLSRHIAKLLQQKTGQEQLAARVSARNAVLSRINLDSIDMMALSQFVYKTYHCKLPITTLFQNDLTVRQVADMITQTPDQAIHDMPSDTSAVNGAIVSTPEWWTKLQKTLDEVRGLPGTDSLSNDHGAGKTVFLTGATGYLGTHILRQLVRDHRVSKVCVLVRAGCPEGALARIIQEARTARWWQDDYRRVIEAWPGDLAQRRLGLSDRHWAILCGDTVDAIIHNGAVVHWGYDYEVLEPANVRSTLQLLQALAHSSTTVSFTYVSALIAVDDALSADSEGHIPPMNIPDGYTRTKYASELLIMEFARSHPSLRHRLRIVRPGFIIGTVNDGVANVDDMLWRVVATAVTTSSYNASEPDSWLFVSAVDWAANLIVYETLHAQPMPSVASSTVARFPMTDGLSMRDFWQAVSLGLGRKLVPVPAAEWMATLEKQVDAVGISHILLPVMDFLRSSGGCLGIPPSSSFSSSSPAPPPQLPVPRDQSSSLTNMIRQAVVRNAEYLASLESLSAMITASSTKTSISGGLAPSEVFTRRNKIAAPAQGSAVL